MKKIFLDVLFVIFGLFFVFFSVSHVYAAEDNKEYYINVSYMYTSGNFINQYTHSDYEFILPTGYSVYVYSDPAIGNVVVILHDGATYYEDNLVHTGFTYRTYKDGSYATDKSPLTLNHIPIFNVADYVGSLNDLGHSVSFSVYGSDVDTNIPFFESKSALADYVIRGIDDGWLNKPEYDLSVEHDFNSDVWSPDVPLPELSKISHSGFTLDNWSEDYYVDIIVKNHLSRVRIMQNASGGGSVPTVVDTEPWYSEHYWNFTLHDVLTSRAVVDINDIYGIDIQGALIEDFKSWSLEHPSIKDIQGYSWALIGQADDYLAKYVYKVDSDLSDMVQLKNSGQAQTEYYVRYVTLDGNYGQWAHYRLRDYSYNGQGERIEVSRVTSGSVDNSGKTSNPITGTTDSNGNIDYTPIVDTNVDVNIGQLRDVLYSFADGVGQLPSLIAQIFSFLPWWINAVIAGGIATCVTLRVLGR